MFNVAGESSDDSHEYCDEDCGCCDKDEDQAYLDQVATKNYEDALKDNVDEADPEELLRYTLKGIHVPISMLRDSEAVPIDEQAEMGRECPFPAVVVQTMVTDPIVVTSLGSDTMISASAEAIAILNHQKKHKKHERRGRGSEKPIPGGQHVSGIITPHMRPPPPTPPEYATFPYTLSTPHLPVFHHYTDDALLHQYQVERAKDSLAFDQQTAKIKQYLLSAKIERGGVGFLEESEYSVDLASREDARKVQGMTIQRNRGMPETGLVGSEGTTLDSATNIQDGLNTPGHQIGEVAWEGKSRAAISKYGHHSRSCPKPKKFAPTLPTDFDFAKHVAKYITSGSIRHQHSRNVTEDTTGTMTILKTWIEITQLITVPSADQLNWEDVRTADENVKAARKETRDKKRTKVKSIAVDGRTHQTNSDVDADLDTDSDKDNNDKPANQPATEVNVKELLGAVARIKGTGQLSQGVSLSQYLTQVKKDMKQSNVSK